MLCNLRQGLMITASIDCPKSMGSTSTTAFGHGKYLAFQMRNRPALQGKWPLRIKHMLLKPGVNLGQTWWPNYIKNCHIGALGSPGSQKKYHSSSSSKSCSELRAVQNSELWTLRNSADSSMLLSLVSLVGSSISSICLGLLSLARERWFSGHTGISCGLVGVG